jgi:MFS transporter, DHA1 family, multidrug resistance protein
MPGKAADPPALMTLIALSGLSVVSLNMFLPSLANIAHEFQADYALVNLCIAGYAAVSAVLQLVMGPLSDRFGRRPVILAALLLFLVASLGCLLAANVWVFLAFRMMQAVIAPAYAVSVAIIRDFSAGNKAASSIGYVAMASAVAPMLAPMLGGTLDELYGWRASFWAFLVMGGATLALCWLDLRETNKTPAATFARQFRSYAKLVGSGRFWGYALCMTFSRGAFFIFIGGASLVAVSTFRISTAELGFYMGTITVGFVLGSFLCGRFSERYGLTTMMLMGGLVACVGLVLGILLCFYDAVNLPMYFGACACVGLGNGLAIPSSNAGVVSVRPELAGSASGLSAALTVGGGALLSAITGAVLTEANAAPTLLAMMLLSSGMALLATLYVMRLDVQENPLKRELDA